MLFKKIGEHIKILYLKKIKKLDDGDINVLAMRKSGMTIGEDCRFFSHIHSNEPFLITIGNSCVFASNVSLLTHDNSIGKYKKGVTDLVGKINIGNNCFIGQNAILLPGVTIGDNSIVGAGSVVSHSFPADSVICGNPAKRLCSVEDFVEKNKDFAVDFSKIQYSVRAKYFEEHPEKLVVKKEK